MDSFERLQCVPGTPVSAGKGGGRGAAAAAEQRTVDIVVTRPPSCEAEGACPDNLCFTR